MPAARRSGNPATRAKAKTAKATRATGPTPRPTGKTSTGKYSLAKYRQDAGEPFVLEVDDDHEIVIPRPTGDVMMMLADKHKDRDPNEVGNPHEDLKDLLGDMYDEVWPIIAEEPYEVMLGFLDDLSTHFGMGPGMGESPASAG